VQQFWLGRRTENLNHSESVAIGKVGSVCLRRGVLLSLVVFLVAGFFLEGSTAFPLARSVGSANWTAGAKRSISGSAVGTSRTMNACRGMSWQGDKD